MRGGQSVISIQKLVIGEQIRVIRVVIQKAKQQNERKNMNKKFDELAKGLAQSTTRRQALKKLGGGLAGMALACFGLASKAEAGKKKCLPSGGPCTNYFDRKGIVINNCCSDVCYCHTPGPQGGCDYWICA
jgi:hypothetical protein